MVQPSQFKDYLADAVSAAAATLSADGTPTATVLQRPRSEAHGDFSSPLPLTLAKALRQKPMEIAAQLHAALNLPPFISASAVAAPGFINFTIAPQAKVQVVGEVLAAAEAYGRQPPKAETLLLEFVSANPTGPLHVGHGRACAYGDALAKILRAAGVTVQCEYYVNDAGRQMDILAASVWLRHWQKDVGTALPAGAYRGDYLLPIAAQLAPHLAVSSPPPPELLAQASAAENEDAAADALVAAARQALGNAAAYDTLRQHLSNLMLDEVIKKDMAALNVEVGEIRFFSETALHADGKVADAVATLQQRGTLREEDGALWFNAAAYGDEKDRVLRRANGELTYFAADIAYHMNKLARPHAPQHTYALLNVLGADHHGYVPRLSAALQALGHSAECLQVEIIQFVALFEDGKRLKMSTRAGEFITLRTLVQEVGAEAARFYYLNRKNDQHLDFDLTAAKAQERKNPIYYLHYANARIFSVLNKWQENWQGEEAALAQADTAALAQDEAAVRLCTEMLTYPEVVAAAAAERAPHLLTVYLHNLAAQVHNFYEQTRILPPAGEALTAPALALLALLRAAAQVLNNGADLLGLRLPKKM